jgi:hypothetical protein
LFDHSQGHGQKREGALSAMHMSKSFGGAQQIMRDTRTITTENGFLGPYSPKLKVGSIQSMIFQSNNAGPWYLS